MATVLTPAISEQPNGFPAENHKQQTMKALVYDGPGRKPPENLCQTEITASTDANVSVHGTKVDLHLEQLWDRNITITTRLVDTVSTPMLLNVLRSKKLDPKLLITHRFKLAQILDAYDTFAHAAKTRALKVIIEA